MSKSSARRPKWSPAELARAAKERFLALDASTFAKWSFRCILESNNFELFFKYVELPTFDIASDALATFKFFELSEKLLASPKYATRRQIL